MKTLVAALCMALAACRPCGAEAVANDGNPSKQPDGAPLTAAFCATPEADRIYGNIKSCSMAACDQGDKESCAIARTFATQHAPHDETESGEPGRATDRLEGMPYLDARPVILKFGWKPLTDGCGSGGVREDTCRKYPEIGNCQGTWPAFCDMTFARRGRCLTVVTYGGVPSDDTVVRDVRFSRGPCAKDPNEGTP